MPFSLAVTFGCDISIVDIAIQSHLIYEDVGSARPEICGYYNVLPCPWHISLLSRLGIPRPSFPKCSAHTEAAALPSNGTSPQSANTRKRNVVLLLYCPMISLCCLRSSNPED